MGIYDSNPVVLAATELDVRLAGKVLLDKQELVLREGERVGRGRITTIRQQKDTIQEAEAVMEIGLVVNCPIAIMEGDDLRIERQ